MKPKIVKAILTISDPWDNSSSILGVIEEISILDEFGLLFKGESEKKYLLSTRYEGDQIENIWKSKYLIVNIFDISGLLKESKDKGEYFIGSGSIRIINTK